jgi:hypothetical protein
MPLCQIYLISPGDSGLYARYAGGYYILKGGNAGEELVDLDLAKFILHHHPGRSPIGGNRPMIPTTTQFPIRTPGLLWGG